MSIRYHCLFMFDPSGDFVPEPFEAHSTFLPRVHDAIMHKGERYFVYVVEYSFDMGCLSDPFVVGLHKLKVLDQ